MPIASHKQLMDDIDNKRLTQLTFHLDKIDIPADGRLSPNTFLKKHLVVSSDIAVYSTIENKLQLVDLFNKIEKYHKESARIKHPPIHISFICPPRLLSKVDNQIINPDCKSKLRELITHIRSAISHLNQLLVSTEATKAEQEARFYSFDDIMKYHKSSQDTMTSICAFVVSLIPRGIYYITAILDIIICINFKLTYKLPVHLNRTDSSQTHEAAVGLFSIIPFTLTYIGMAIGGAIGLALNMALFLIAVLSLCIIEPTKLLLNWESAHDLPECYYESIQSILQIQDDTNVARYALMGIMMPYNIEFNFDKATIPRPTLTRDCNDETTHQNSTNDTVIAQNESHPNERTEVNDTVKVDESVNAVNVASTERQINDPQYMPMLQDLSFDSRRLIAHFFLRQQCNVSDSEAEELLNQAEVDYTNHLNKTTGGFYEIC